MPVVTIRMESRRTRKTTEMMRAAVDDLASGNVSHAFVVCPMASMEDSVKGMLRGSNGYDVLFDRSRTSWMCAAKAKNDLWASLLIMAADQKRKAGLYVDEGWFFGKILGETADERQSRLNMLRSCCSVVRFNMSLDQKVDTGLLQMLSTLDEWGCRYNDVKVVIPVKRLVPNARLPERAHPDDAGADVYAVSWSEAFVNDRIVITYGTGLAAAAPQGKWLDLRPRSSVCKTGMWMCNSVGTIDAGYRGEIMMKFYCDRSLADDRTYKVGDRIGQLVVMPDVSPLDVEFVEVDELPDANDRQGGFGSTGK